MGDEWQILLGYTAVILTVVGLFGAASAFVLKRIERQREDMRKRLEELSERTRGQVKDLYAKIEELRDKTMGRADLEERLKRIERTANGMIGKCAPEKP